MSNFVPEKTALGIEFGSTRIKAVLIGPEHTPLAQGDYTWENQLHNGIWTYPLEQVWHGLQSAYAALAADVQQKYGCTLTKVGCIGISAMMHGYLAFDANGEPPGPVPRAVDRPYMTDDLPHLLLDLAGLSCRWFDPTRSVINDRFDASRPRLLRDDKVDYDLIMRQAKGNAETNKGA